ncbi:PH domain-containing protein [Leptospira sp. severe_002]|uniref:PH domain-containing protein n=1 Tax=Leptospira sp. severe_002 TaxID=2838237 RepID=UPI001E3185B4|nr:PH domain-containing protein [Leptospira sp. severe_002]
MSYTQSVLQPGETIVAQGRLHWVIYSGAIGALVAGVIVVGLERKYIPDYTIIIAATALLFGALFAGTFMHAWFKRFITEFAITNRRVIYKRGLIWRKTVEMNMDKVATVDVDQSVLGRMLDYGKVQVFSAGGGQGIDVRESIASPIALRNAITAK